MLFFFIVVRTATVTRSFVAAAGGDLKFDAVENV